MSINEIKFEFLDKYENDDFEIIFSLEYIHSFSGSIDLVFAYIENQEEEKEYFILYKRIFMDAKKIKLTNNEAQHIIKLIKNARISITPPENFGLDGYSCIITFFNSGNFSQYKWWSEPDGDWGVFEKLVYVIFQHIKNNDEES